MTPEETVEAYYEALRSGEPLASFFVESPDVVKFGIGEQLVGYADLADGLSDQTARTRDWTVESRDLRVVDRGDHAAVSDAVRLEWYDTTGYEDHAYDTRWSGTLTRVDETEDGGGDGPKGTDRDDDEAEWKFLGLHVSVPGPTAEE
ncbi:nuclear transport factor 2 family protein [Halobaculum sp. MBLA0147]|uniref:nuclear transport factor 2 family protein n=1 Tax=Halobaculum sp. MBLA0147 TaxID=3079934 RepID=UPI00352606B4